MVGGGYFFFLFGCFRMKEKRADGVAGSLQTPRVLEARKQEEASGMKKKKAEKEMAKEVAVAQNRRLISDGEEAATHIHLSFRPHQLYKKGYILAC